MSRSFLWYLHRNDRRVLDSLTILFRDMLYISTTRNGSSTCVSVFTITRPKGAS